MSPSNLIALPAKVAAVLLGLLLPFVIAHTYRVPAGTGQVGFDVELSTAGNGELHVDPQGRVALASGLEPGGASAAGEVVVRNQTAARLGLAPVATAPVSDADHSVWIAVTRGNRTLASAPLAELRRAPRPAFTLGAHERARLRLSAWLPENTPAGWEGRIAHVQIGWRSWIDGKARR